MTGREHVSRGLVRTRPQAMDSWLPLVAVVWTGACIRLAVALFSGEAFTDGAVAALIVFVLVPIFWSASLRRCWRLRLECPPGTPSQSP